MIRRGKNWSFADRAAALLAGSATLAFIFKHGVLDKFKALVRAIYDLGIIADGALPSLVAGSIFFLVVNRFSEIKERSVIDPWIEKKSRFVVGQFDAMVSEFSKASGVFLDLNSSEADFKSALTNILIASPAPLVDYSGTPYRWPVYLKHQMDRARRSISSLLDRMGYLSATEVKIISEVEDHHLFYLIDSMQTMPFGPTVNLGYTASSFRGFADALSPMRLED